ncbi:SH3 domain containing protein [Acanthamoeba castellanii str. Neff]|uniref:SH3 domain containing protein n=1 Tax=Acanthamoeba castellanii (strain ATCC 30010 / Neff) TaxID=1257118 RepID=L8GND5_ACACF|nr:SH3 domain containing protein [Acanthamoeba castellanii str. Neff]ELR13731.1 SH3 domain containing protein [Acanthamoeba castellanii str. Neff]
MNENCDEKPWYLAKRQGQVGLVQGVYVEVADAAGDPLFTPRGQPDAKPVGAASSPAAGGGRARVAFEYQAQRDDELDLVFDEVIIVHQRSDSGWWEGELVSTKRRGHFPANYVVDMA